MEGDLVKHLDADYLLAEAIHEVAGLVEDGQLKRPVEHSYDFESVFQGRRMDNGWRNSGLPWTYEINPERMRLPM